MSKQKCSPCGVVSRQLDMYEPRSPQSTTVFLVVMTLPLFLAFGITQHMYLMSNLWNIFTSAFYTKALEVSLVGCTNEPTYESEQYKHYMPHPCVRYSFSEEFTIPRSKIKTHEHVWSYIVGTCWTFKGESYQVPGTKHQHTPQSENSRLRKPAHFRQYCSRDETHLPPPIEYFWVLYSFCDW